MKRNLLLAGLFAAVLACVSPVTASENSPSIRGDVLELQSMILSSQQRQGIVQENPVAGITDPASLEAATSTPGLTDLGTSDQAPLETAASTPGLTDLGTSDQAPLETAASTPGLTDLGTSAPAPLETVTTATSDMALSAVAEPTREQQLANHGLMLLVSDLAWLRVDYRRDYSLGAAVERGSLSPLAAIRVYAPDKLPEALAILRGEKQYA